MTTTNSNMYNNCGCITNTVDGLDPITQQFLNDMAAAGTYYTAQQQIAINNLVLSLKSGSGSVTSVNGVLPDEAGNIELAPIDINAIGEDEVDLYTDISPTGPNAIVRAEHDNSPDGDNTPSFFLRFGNSLHYIITIEQ